MGMSFIRECYRSVQTRLQDSSNSLQFATGLAVVVRTWREGQNPVASISSEMFSGFTQKSSKRLTLSGSFK